MAVAGRAYEIDCIIPASGFEGGTEYKRRAGFDPTGREGQKLSEAWPDDDGRGGPHPGYFNNEGKDPGPAARLNVGYPAGPAANFKSLEDWRSSGAFEGLAFR